ncbi:MAG: hypothetical protein V1769_07085, partial [Thermoplasmatota archaeon]
MKQVKNQILFAALTMLFLLFPTYHAISSIDIVEKTYTPMSTINAIYSGNLRIYIVEIESRWNMENGQPYKYAFYDFAFNAPITIQYGETYENTIRWQGDVGEDNMLIIASVFNKESQRKYSDPPSGRPFDAHFIDACAGVTPGQTDSNVKNEEFTHTVFCEVGTETSCSKCPILAQYLDHIFEEGTYPFYFVEMVTDMNITANNRMIEYNQKSYPSAYYDGGLDLVIGSGKNTTYHEEVIIQSGRRDVHELNLTLYSTWVGDGAVDLTISITNHEELPNTAPEKPTILGPSSGRIGERCEFQVSSIDPDFDDVFYMFDWGDETYSNWLGPYTSGEEITHDHMWTKQGNYLVKVKAKDVTGFETDWAWLQISMPKNKTMDLMFFRLFDLFP